MTRSTRARSTTRWDDEDLNQLKTVPGDVFEVAITEEIVYGD
jgi:hypothetical protein